jgi:hypothetical protein
MLSHQTLIIWSNLTARRDASYSRKCTVRKIPAQMLLGHRRHLVLPFKRLNTHSPAGAGCKNCIRSIPSNVRSRWPRGLRPLGCWGRGFESRSGHGCCLLCCPVQVEVSETGWSLVQRSPTVCLIVCDHRNSERCPMFQMGTTRKWMIPSNDLGVFSARHELAHIPSFWVLRAYPNLKSSGSQRAGNSEYRKAGVFLWRNAVPEVLS